MRTWEYSPAARAVSFVLSLSVLHLMLPVTGLAQVNVGMAGLSSGGTVTGPILFPDGTAGAPSIAWASDADGSGTGFFRPTTNALGFTANGTEYVRLDAGNIGMRSANSIYWATGALGTAATLVLAQEAAATLQLGLDATTAAVDQTISAADAITNADISGADLTVATGTGMGTGAVSSFIVQTPTIAAAGANAQSLATRLTINSSGLLIGATTQAALGTPANGTIIYCSDCTIANPCAGSGTGAIAKRLNGAWVCN